MANVCVFGVAPVQSLDSVDHAAQNQWRQAFRKSAVGRVCFLGFSLWVFPVSDSSAETDANHWHQSIYDHLHGLAEKALRGERAGHSLQPTLLVNDAYMRLQEQQNLDPADRSQMLAAGATIIRRLLVDYARGRKRLKRGGAEGRGIPLPVSVEVDAKGLDVLELNDALEALAAELPRAARIVELKFFGGLTGDEIAEQLDVSLRTVNNDWKYAKAFLYRELGPDSESTETDG